MTSCDSIIRGKLKFLRELIPFIFGTRESCWVAFNGMVYNCTPYMEYHPGGGDELMKSAGLIDFQMLDCLTGIQYKVMMGRHCSIKSIAGSIWNAF